MCAAHPPPPPPVQVGGIVSNNSSGMCCGVSQNTYHTLKDMRIVLVDGAGERPRSCHRIGLLPPACLPPLPSPPPGCGVPTRERIASCIEQFA